MTQQGHSIVRYSTVLLRSNWMVELSFLPLICLLFSDHVSLLWKALKYIPFEARGCTHESMDVEALAFRNLSLASSLLNMDG